MSLPHTLQVITGRATGRPLEYRGRTCCTRVNSPAVRGLLLFVLLAVLLAMPAAAIPASGSPTGPVANFSANTTSGFVPMTVMFTDSSTGTAPLSYEWDFGDGSPNETVQDPVHTYTGGGTYTVTLTVSNSVGNSTLELPGYIDAQVPLPPLGGSKGYFLIHSNVDGAAVYFNGDSFEGYIENGTLLVQICLTCTPIRTFTVEKCGYFALTQNITQYPAKNETVDLYANLTAPREPLIWDFTANVTEGSAPLTVGFSSSGIGIAQAWNWSFGDGTYSDEREPGPYLRRGRGLHGQPPGEQQCLPGQQRGQGGLYQRRGNPTLQGGFHLLAGDRRHTPDGALHRPLHRRPDHDRVQFR